MAGWKLRKDKTPEETPGAGPEAAGPAEGTAAEETAGEEAAAKEAHTKALTAAPFLDTVPGLPDFDSADLHFSGSEHDYTAQHGDGPLTLVDYTETAASPAPQHDTHSYNAPMSEAIAMPPPMDPADFFEPSSFTLDKSPSAEYLPDEEETGEASFEPLQTSSWLSSDFGAEIPAVAPFVLDTPAAASPQEAPRITVRIGRLSATFDLTKDVTTIGRPDSALHYYPDIEVEMDDAVSRRHAEIVKRSNGYCLVDTGSTNGTRLNGETLLPHQEQVLSHGDRIHMGDRTEITFE